MRHMEYVFPNLGYANIKDQFMLGDKLIIAPMLQKNQLSRSVIIPAGKWKDDEGKIIKGPVKISIQVPLNRLPYYELVSTSFK